MNGDKLGGVLHSAAEYWNMPVETSPQTYIG